MLEDHHQPGQVDACGCFTAPHHSLVMVNELGMDAYFAEVSLLNCSFCGQHWLRYFYEVEAFTASGRWYLGAIKVEQVLQLTADNAKTVMESLDWYFFGGSYFGGKSGRTMGRIYLNP